MKRTHLIGLALLACLGACAKLRIDVDVYKGPLANEEQIQIQELIALTTGAKPLLVQLRDELESGARSISAKEWRMRSDYQDGYMKPRVGGQDLTFLSAQAQSVNEVLGLYGDLAEEAHADRLARIVQLSSQYRHHLRRLNQDLPGQKGRETELAELLGSEGGDFAKRVAGFFSIVGGQRGAVPLVKAMRGAGADLGDSPLRVTSTSSPPEFGANVAFDVLVKIQTWQSALSTISTLSEQQRSEVAAAGVTIAQSFLDARATLRELMRECAQLAIDLLATPAPTSEEVERAHSALVAALTMSSWRVLAKGLEPDRAFTEAERKRYPRLMHVKERLSAHLPVIVETMRANSTPDSMQRERFIAQVLSWIDDENPARTIANTAQALLDLDELAAHGRFRTDDALQRAYDRFGAASGPTSDAQVPLPESEAIRDSLAKIHPTGLTGGRPATGLDRHTSQYLEITRNERSPDPQLLRELLRSLVQFGEKVRILSGMAPLLGNGPRGLFDILQAVGNSILTQADAIQRSHHLLDDDDEQTRHLREAAASFAMEQDARALAGTDWPRTPATVLDGKARNVLDHFARQLSYAFARELATNGETERAKRLSAAHAYIEEEMTKHVYLRHAAAYLRNSYPSPDLQPTPLHLQNGTGSMLIADTDRRKTAEKLDKQFWQNVNQVTASGTGDTNIALIKDDIGNWQLKEYSGDTRQIMKSMSALVRFATSAGVSPQALMDAAELQPLLDKARSGKLGKDDPEKLEAIRERQGKSAGRAGTTESAVRVAIQHGAELNAELRAWVKTIVTDQTAVDAVASPKPPEAGAELSAIAAAADAIHAEFRALIQVPDWTASLDRKAKFAEFFARRREQVRGLQLALFGPAATASNDAPSK